jgi:hypothetical protein
MDEQPEATAFTYEDAARARPVNRSNRTVSRPQPSALSALTDHVTTLREQLVKAQAEFAAREGQLGAERDLERVAAELDRAGWADERARAAEERGKDTEERLRLQARVDELTAELARLQATPPAARRGFVVLPHVILLPAASLRMLPTARCEGSDATYGGRPLTSPISRCAACRRGRIATPDCIGEFRAHSMRHLWLHGRPLQQGGHPGRVCVLG